MLTCCQDFSISSSRSAILSIISLLIPFSIRICSTLDECTVNRHFLHPVNAVFAIDLMLFGNVTDSKLLQFAKARSEIAFRPFSTTTVVKFVQFAKKCYNIK